MKNSMVLNIGKHRKKLYRMAFILIVIVLLSLCVYAFAEDAGDTGKDILSGTTSDATTTLGEGGKKWLYLIEGISSIFAYIKTKNVLVLGGVIVVAIMINLILHLAGAK